MGIFILKDLKKIIVGILIGLVVGLWFGSNLAKDKSIFTNPFGSDTIQSKLKSTGDKVLEQSGKALEKSGKALRDAVSKNN